MRGLGLSECVQSSPLRALREGREWSQQMQNGHLTQQGSVHRAAQEALQDGSSPERETEWTGNELHNDICKGYTCAWPLTSDCPAKEVSQA